MSTINPTPELSPQTEPTPEATPPSSPVIRDSTTVRNFRTGSPEGFLPLLNRDLGLALSCEAFQSLQDYFKNTALRDPSVGELRLLDALGRKKTPAPARITVEELITHSPAIAETWADMMAKHGSLYGASGIFRSGKAATPPCSLLEALALTGRYLRRLGRYAEEKTLLLATPAQEAIAATQGYTSVARIRIGDGTRSLWNRQSPPHEESACRTGDVILYLPRLKLGQVQRLMAIEAQKNRPSLGAIRAVTDESLLMTLLGMCPAADLHVNRLGAGTSTSQQIPTDLLCGTPTVEPDGTCSYLLCVPVKQVQTMNQTLQDLGLAAVACGQVRTGGNVVFYTRDGEGARDIPCATLPVELLRSAAQTYAYTMRPEAYEAPCPAISSPILTRLPSAVPRENGLTPDHHETVALTLHEGRILRIPEADTLLTALSVDIAQPHTAFSAAAELTNVVARLPAEHGVSPETIRLSVVMTVSGQDQLTDGTVLAAICGIHCAAAQLALSVEDSVILTVPSDIPLRITITAMAVDGELCAEHAPTSDRQWHTPRQAESTDAPRYMLPVLRRSYEDSLKALSAALGQDSGATCIIRPLAMNANRNEESGETVYTLHPDSQNKLIALLEQRTVPIFSMNAADTRLLLAQPAVLEALNRRLELGYSTLVLGESCIAFAEHGFLPAALTALRTLPAKDGRATATYNFPVEPSTRLLRTNPLSPQELSEAIGTRHLMALHLPGGITIPDGFVGSDGLVLGILNGVDTTILTRMQGYSFVL